MSTPAWSLIRFHARAGVRLAWRVAIPVFTAPTVALGVSHDPNASFHAFAHGAALADGGLSAPLLLALASVAVASWAAPRLSYGVSAWLRHLPAGDRAQRLAVTGALALAQLPIVILWLAAWIVVELTGSGAADNVRFFSMLLLPVGVAFYTVPTGTRIRSRAPARLGGLAATAAAISGSGALMGLSIGALWAAERRMGTLELSNRSRVFRPVPYSGLVPLPIRVTWRSLPKSFWSSYLLPVLCLVVLAFFVRNNDLAPEHIGLAARLAGGVGLVAFVITLGASIAKDRPPWPWVRSLPQSSFRRVTEDALFLAIAASPILVGLALVSPSAAAIIALTVPYVTLRTSAAMRERRSPTDSLVLAELLLAAGLVAVLPWVVAGAVALTPMAGRWAVTREHGAGARTRNPTQTGEGDTQSWTGR